MVQSLTKNNQNLKNQISNSIHSNLKSYYYVIKLYLYDVVEMHQKEFNNELFDLLFNLNPYDCLIQEDFNNFNCTPEIFELDRNLLLSEMYGENINSRNYQNFIAKYCLSLALCLMDCFEKWLVKGVDPRYNKDQSILVRKARKYFEEQWLNSPYREDLTKFE